MQMFLIELSIRTVRLYFARCGFTSQYQLKRTYEQRLSVVEKWPKEEYLAIVTLAKAVKAQISLGDKSVVLCVAHYWRGYGP